MEERRTPLELARLSGRDEIVAWLKDRLDRLRLESAAAKADDADRDADGGGGGKSRRSRGDRGRHPSDYYGRDRYSSADSAGGKDDDDGG